MLSNAPQNCAALKALHDKLVENATELSCLQADIVFLTAVADYYSVSIDYGEWAFAIDQAGAEAWQPLGRLRSELAAAIAEARDGDASPLPSPW